MADPPRRPPLADTTRNVRNPVSLRFMSNVHKVQDNERCLTRPESSPTSSEDGRVSKGTNPHRRLRKTHETPDARQPFTYDNDAQSNSAAPFVSDTQAEEKFYIGPWHLGETLGAGSSARVRLCQHRITHQLAAVKIASKKSCLLSQSGSIANLHNWDKNQPEIIDGEMRIPMTTEREVAMLALIDHPNITKLYDIWENREDMFAYPIFPAGS
jgi:serine/threonine-protein kinase HSL1, negative regulator of Swe1 kinase